MRSVLRCGLVLTRAGGSCCSCSVCLADQKRDGISVSRSLRGCRRGERDPFVPVRPAAALHAAPRLRVRVLRRRAHAGGPARAHTPGHGGRDGRAGTARAARRSRCSGAVTGERGHAAGAVALVGGRAAPARAVRIPHAQRAQARRGRWGLMGRRWRRRREGRCAWGHGGVVVQHGKQPGGRSRLRISTPQGLPSVHGREPILLRTLLVSSTAQRSAAQRSAAQRRAAVCHREFARDSFNLSHSLLFVCLFVRLHVQLRTSALCGRRGGSVELQHSKSRSDGSRVDGVGSGGVDAGRAAAEGRPGAAAPGPHLPRVKPPR